MSTNPVESFRTHANYIRAFGLLVFEPIPRHHTNMYQHLLRRIQAAGVLNERPRRDLDAEQVRTSIQTAWGTETLLLMTERMASEQEILRLSNNWSVIQTYYVLYHCAQALHCAKDQPRPESHPRTQNIFFDQWANRTLQLAPWSFAFGANGPVNAPQDVVINASIHAWRRADDRDNWSLAAKSLMTTRRESAMDRKHELRERKWQEKKRQWRAQEQTRCAAGKRPRAEPRIPVPQLTPEEHTRIESQLRPYTLMDYLYRLRLKTNYEDSNMFTDGPDDDNASHYVRNALCRIAGGTLFLYELVISRLVGHDTFFGWLNGWVKRNLPHQYDRGVAARRPFHEE